MHEMPSDSWRRIALRPGPERDRSPPPGSIASVDSRSRCGDSSRQPHLSRGGQKWRSHRRKAVESGYLYGPVNGRKGAAGFLREIEPSRVRPGGKIAYAVI